MGADTLSTNDVQELKARASRHGQEHLFKFYDQLSPASQRKLLEQVAALEFDVVERLIGEWIKGGARPAETGHLEPAPVVTTPRTPEEFERARQARAAGEEAYRKGRVGCFLVAGGQGTRLGFDGPKGAYAIGPVTERTLFQLHAEKIHALRKCYSAAVPWLVMTSDANDAETREFFETHDYFGLERGSVRIFKQANMPAVDARSGKILLQAKDEIALSPNGHGGSIKALYESGSTAWLRGMGVDTLFYFQVDNVLVKIGDPEFIGYHVLARSQMSTKVCRKRDWKEKVGVLGLRGGRLCVIEYSDLPETVAKETSPDGTLKWWAGSIAIHVLDTGFIEELNRGGFQLPYHKAEKSVPHIGPDGQPAPLKPGEKNGIKFETFVFDALAAARRTANIETPRQEDFSPVKNATGEDSPATARRDMMEQYARWLNAAGTGAGTGTGTGTGTKIPRAPDGSLDCRIEISPLTSLEGEHLAGKAPEEIQPGQSVVL